MDTTAKENVFNQKQCLKFTFEIERGNLAALSLSESCLQMINVLTFLLADQKSPMAMLSYRALSEYINQYDIKSLGKKLHM